MIAIQGAGDSGPGLPMRGMAPLAVAGTLAATLLLRAGV
jgi:hypothetical protein